MSRRPPNLLEELNERAWALADQAESLAREMNIRSFVDESGARVLDFGTAHIGTLSAGISFPAERYFSISKRVIFDLLKLLKTWFGILFRPVWDNSIPLVCDAIRL